MEYAEYEWLTRIEAKLDFLLTKLQEAEDKAKGKKPEEEMGRDEEDARR